MNAAVNSVSSTPSCPGTEKSRKATATAQLSSAMDICRLWIEHGSRRWG